MALGILVLGGVRRFQNGNRHGGFPGDFPGGVGSRIGEGIHAHLIFLGGIGESAVLGYSDSAPPGLPDDGIGDGFSLRVGDFQFSGVGKIFVSFQGHILRHRGFVLTAPEGNGHDRCLCHVGIVNGQVAHLDFPVRFPGDRGKGHHSHLVRGQNIPGLQDPAAQSKAAALGQIRQTDARKGCFAAEIFRAEAVGHTAVDFCRGGRFSTV